MIPVANPPATYAGTLTFQPSGEVIQKHYAWDGTKYVEVKKANK